MKSEKEKVTVSIEELSAISEYIERQARRYSNNAYEKHGKRGYKGYCWRMYAISDALRGIASKIDLRVQALETIQSMVDKGEDMESTKKYVYSRGGVPSFIKGDWGFKE